jgi:hypothetical protein
LYPSLSQLTPILSPIEKDNNSSLKSYIEDFSPIFDFIVKLKIDI